MRSRRPIRPRPVPASGASTGAARPFSTRTDKTALGLVHADHDAHLRTGCVAQCVGQALLHHAEGQVRDRLRDTVAVALEPTGDVEPAAASAGDHLVDQREVGPATPVVLAAAEQLDEPLEVLGPLPSGLGDGREGLLGPSGVGVDEALPGSGLDHHHADRVADDVVQLAGDPGSLVPQGDLGEELPLVLELLGAHGQLVGGLLAQSQHRAGDVRRHGEHQRSDPAARSRRGSRTAPGRPGRTGPPARPRDPTSRAPAPRS